MGWRDRVDKSFADIGDIANRDQKMKKTEKERKEGSKVFFKGPSHNSHYPQKGAEGGGGKPKNPEQIPAPEPTGMGAAYADLWNRAWTLADYIDNPQGAPLADRRAKLPELEKMRARMAEIERQAAPTAGPEPETSPAETWHTWEAIDTTTRDTNQEQCPAMCKRSGKCYAAAYFQGKPGKAKNCEPDGCKWRAEQ